MAGFGAKVKLSVDRSTAAKAEFNEQINSLTKQIKISNKFVVLQKDMDRVRTSAQTMLNKSPIKITNIDCSQAVTKLRKDLQNVINSLSIKNGVSITGLVDPSGAGTITTQIDNIADAAARGQDEVNRFNAQMSVLKDTMSSLASAYKTVLPGGKNAIADTEQLNVIVQKYTELKQKIEEVKSSATVASSEKLAALQQEAIALQNEIAQIAQARIAHEQAEAAAKQAGKAKQEEAEAAAKAEAEYRSQLEKVNSLILQTKKNMDSWGASKNGKTSSEYANLQEYVSELEALRAKLLLSGTAVDDFGDKFGNLKTKISNSSTIIKEAGENTKTFADHVGGLASKFTSWLTISQIIMQVYRALKEMVSVVVEVDTAMTELRKVTDETEATYNKFLDNAASRAKKLGATLADVVTASADFARLGFGLEDAEKLADAAIVYKNVGDGIEDISQASESIIATLQAFSDEISPDEVMLIVDKFNEVGNNFAISSEGVGEVLLRSAAAMKAANNTLDETIALAAAANTIVQNPETVGTTLKTVSMYLRAAKTEAEDAGEATDGMATSVSELREELLQLTNNKVDIQIDEDTFKSTYQILKELSDVWDELTDLTKANILEMVGGKRNANVVAALLENFTIAEAALTDSANAAGSALAENEKHLDSIEGKVSKFKATFQELSTTLIDSNFVKQIVDFGTGLLTLLNSVAKLIESVGGLNTVLIATAGILAAIKLDAIKVFIGTTLPNVFKKLISPITTVITALSRLPAVIKSFRSGTALAVPGVSRFDAALKALGISASAAQIAIGALTVVITAAIAIYNKHQQKLQEQRDAAIDAANSAGELSDEIVDLTNKYLELSEAVKTDASAKDDLLSTQDELIKKLDLEKGRIDELVEKYGNLTDAIKAASIESLQSAERDLRGGLSAYKDQLIDDADEGLFGSDSISISRGVTGKKNRDEQKELYKGLQALEQAGLISSGSYSTYTDNDGSKYSQGFAFFAGLYDDLSTVDGVLNAYKELGDMLDIVSDEIGSDNVLYEAIYEKYNMLSSSANAYNTAVGQLNSNLAQQYMLQGLIGKELPTTKAEFDAYRDGVVAAAQESGQFIGTDEDIANAVDNILRSQTQFAQFYADELVDAGDSAAYYKKQISALTDVMSKLQTAYSALESAEEDMATGHGLTAETISALAAAEENYLDYIYEENGVLKLNTDAWKENANAKMLHDMTEIESEIYSLNEQNRVLAEKNEELERSIELQKQEAEYYLKEGDWANYNAANNAIKGYNDTIEENNAAIAENSDLIRENQGLLAVYGSIYGDITGDISAYNQALENFKNVANVIDSVATSYAGLYNLQSAVADGFTFSLEKILEYAEAYPEILNNAQVTADGELALNEAVVNSFIAGKKAELDAQIDGEIAKLEADKAVLEAKKENATAQLELAKAVVNGESELTQEEAMYKLNAGNALAEALIAMEIDKATAYKLATAAMADNEEEFTRIAMECFQNMDEGSAQMAYNMAQAIYINAKNSSMSIADIAKQAHETALAIRGMANGVVEGSSYSVFSGGSGVYVGSYDYSASDGNFVGTEYNYQAKQISLDEYIADLELDISDYENAIANINGQIATLEALRNTPFESFKNLVDNTSSIVGEKTNQKNEQSAKEEEEEKTKLVEEYIAAIDQYYEALKRLEEVQKRRNSLEKKLEHTEDLSEKIFLSSGLIDVYKEEIEAEKNLMAAKQATIQANIGALRGLGFDVSYDAANNELIIKNLEHLNELTANSAGEYETLQEATNALRKETEELIDTTEQLNDDNADAAENIEDLGYTILETKNNIIDYIEEIYDKQVESYQKIIDLRKELIESAKDEYDYEADVAEKVKEIADLQARIDQLALDDSRSAQAERASLMEELAEKQKDLADTQKDHSTDAQIDALDKMAEDYEQQRADEIEIMRNTVTESEDLWNAFYQTILGNNATVGASVDEYIANAWIRAAQAVNDYSAAMSGIASGGVVINSIPKYHTGGVVDESNVGKDETLALLEKGEIVLNDGKQQVLYKIIDFQTELASKLGTIIGSLTLPDISGALRSMVSGTTENITSNNQSFVFEPHIQVDISHNGEMADTDAKNYGEQIADTAIEKLYSAFERRGISSTRGARLKP